MAANNQQASRTFLPRQLVRPRFRSINPRAIVAIDPVLETIPLSYIRHSLKDLGPRLLRATYNTTATPPTGKLPRELRVVCNDDSVEPPSHVIAACHRVNNRVTLFPLHAIILATNCVNLPTLPILKPDTPSTTDGSIILPVIALYMPSPTSFPMLVSYLYTQRTDQLLSELVPASNVSSTAQLAQALAASLPVKALITHVRKAYGLWANVVALGIFDEKLFHVLEMAWEVLLDALAIRSGQAVDAGITVDGGLD